VDQIGGEDLGVEVALERVVNVFAESFFSIDFLIKF
jgi:hypothetical protein